MAAIATTPYPTSLISNKYQFYCSDEATASGINLAYLAHPEGHSSKMDNSLGGRVTNRDTFLANLCKKYTDESFAWVPISDVVVAPREEQHRVIATVVDKPQSWIDAFPDLSASKKLSMLIYKYATIYLSRVNSKETANGVGVSLNSEALEIAAILRAHQNTNLADLTPEEKSEVDKVDLKSLIGGLDKSRDHFIVFSPPEFLYFALAYVDFRVFNLKGGGYLLTFGADSFELDNNFGLIKKSQTFDAKLYQHRMKVDFWSPEFAAEFAMYSRMIDMGKAGGNMFVVSVNFKFPPRDYPGMAEVKTLSGLTERITAMLKAANETTKAVIEVAAGLDWDQRSKGTLGLVYLLRRCPSADRAKYAKEIAIFFEKLTLPVTSALEFWIPEEDLTAINDSFYFCVETDKPLEGTWATVVQFLEGYGASRAIGAVCGALGSLTNLADEFNGDKVPSVAQWTAWLAVGREMRKREPSLNHNKEYAELKGYSAAPRGASTGRKNEKSLEDVQEFFPECYETDIMHYVGITANDHMLSNNWQFWLEAKEGDRALAEATFFGFDLKELKTPLPCDEYFELKNDVNFRGVPFEDLVTEDYVKDKRYFLYNDAYIIHSDNGGGYNPNNPFHKKSLPKADLWPVLEGKDFPKATAAEKGMYSYFSWCVAKYHYGIVKFHLDSTVTQEFWKIMGKRFLTQGKEFMIWKCGRLHNLELHFFFGTVAMMEVVPEVVVVPPGGAPKPEGAPDPAPVKQGLKVEKKEVVERIDRWSFLRAQAVVYITCLAAYSELHRNFVYFNPLLDLNPIDLVKLEAKEPTMFARMSKTRLGYTDHLYNPKPKTVVVKIDNREVTAIDAYVGGTKRLNTGISSVLNAADPAVAMAREAMLAAKRDTYVTVTKVAPHSAKVVTTPEEKTGRGRFFRNMKRRAKSPKSSTPPNKE